MYVYRQSYWLLALLAVLALGGCLGMDPMAAVFQRSAFSHTAQMEGNAECAALYGNGQFNRLSDKMPVSPGALPSAAMLALNVVPDPQDVQAIQALEGAVRTCQRLREAAGVPTSASEDILNERISRLRLGLYRGDLPYAVYNYGVAQAMKSHNRFLVEGEQSAARGHTVGDERANATIGRAHV